MTDYPLHNELRANIEAARTVGEFLDWMDEQSFFISQFSLGGSNMRPVNRTKTELIGMFLGIDPMALDREKRHMLAVCRGELTDESTLEDLDTLELTSGP